MLNKKTLFCSFLTLLVFLSLSFLNVEAKSEDPPILKLKNTISGYNAFYAYATYDWLKRPFWKLTDKISIGFPTSLGVYMPASGGNITGHHASHWIYNSQTGTTTNYYTTTTAF